MATRDDQRPESIRPGASQRASNGDRTHSGRIRTERPSELWGTDSARFWTKAEGWCWFFAVIGAFMERYNNGWLLQRHGYMTPARTREKLSRAAA